MVYKKKYFSKRKQSEKKTDFLEINNSRFENNWPLALEDQVGQISQNKRTMMMMMMAMITKKKVTVANMF